MRLLRHISQDRFELVSFRNEDTPPYAILSHTWIADQEVSYKELLAGEGRDKAGYAKISFCVQQAHHDGIYYSWVDTCCINKATSDELTEAINSMFRYYQNAAKCYVFLQDVYVPEHIKEPQDYPVTWQRAFKHSRWFTRGWTLQELLAPATVEFYTRNHRHLGDKILLEQDIHEATQIELAALRGRPLPEFSVDERMAWVEKRDTTLMEDKAYCLLGIFGVFMPLIYGEGQNAFKRLRDEIQRSDTSEGHELDPVPNAPNRTVYSQEAKLQELKAAIEKRERIKAELKRVHGFLHFSEIGHRQADVKFAHTHTCEWFLQTDEYQLWIKERHSRQDSNLLWLKGHPGSGKSTLTKFALMETRRARADDIYLSFFFNARGSQLEKTVEGLYRSLLWQLIEQQGACLEELEAVRAAVLAAPEAFVWRIAVLQNILAQAVLLLKHRSFVVVIDALDECDEDEVRDMITYFTDLAERCHLQHIVFRIFLSSRYYPSISSGSSIKLRLEQQHGHFQDIQKYVQATMHAGKGADLEKLRSEVCKRASGIFIWVVLVVRIMNKEHDRGRAHTLWKRLDQLPADLGELFQNIVTRDGDDIEEMKICLQWILYAHRPLRLKELYLAIQAVVDPEGVHEIQQEQISEESMSLYVNNTSRGLAEVRVDDNCVQLIHESVRDFFFGANNLPQTWYDLQREVQGRTHERLKRICCDYLGSSATPKSPPSNPETPRLYGRRRPRNCICGAESCLHHYITRGIWIHAEHASQNIDQSTFLTNFDFGRWKMYYISQVSPFYREGTKPALQGTEVALRGLAAYDCVKMISLFLRRFQNIHVGAAFLVALRDEHYDSVAALCGTASDLHVHETSGRCCCNRWMEELERSKRSIVAEVERESRDIRNRAYSHYEEPDEVEIRISVLPFLIANDQYALASCLMTSSPYTLNEYGENGMTALMVAASKDSHDMVSMLVSQPGISVETACEAGKTAMIYAIQKGNHSIAKLLVNCNGTDIDHIDHQNMTALTYAVGLGDLVLVKWLLNSGATARAKDVEEATSAGLCDFVELLLASGAQFGTSLQIASYKGDLSLVGWLLENGADVNAIDTNAGTALYTASTQGHEQVVELLLANGAQVNLDSGNHRTALRAAFIGNYMGLVGTLLLSGAVDEHGNGKFDFLLSCLEEVD